MSKKYNSVPDTLAHIDSVKVNIHEAICKLFARAGEHDASKLESPEKEAFDKLTPRLKGLKYGSEEYRATLREMKPAISHHYEHNSHHPEHFKKSVCNICFNEMPPPAPNHCPMCGNSQYTEEGFDICGMSLLDLIEMLCDWKAAQQRHDPPGTFEKSFEVNIPRFKISAGLARILKNTVKEMGWE